MEGDAADIGNGGDVVGFIARACSTGKGAGAGARFCQGPVAETHPDSARALSPILPGL